MTSAAVPMRRRIVAVEADFGPGSKPRWAYGSGLLIGGRKVLTAAHTVRGAKAVTVRRPDDEEPWTADLGGALVGDPEHLDLALLHVPEAELLDRVEAALVNRDVVGGELVEGCWAVGYPLFADQQRGRRTLRESAQLDGKIPPLSLLRERLLSLQVTMSPRPLPAQNVALGESEWSGISGAPVFADGNLLVGVVIEHSPARGSSDITVLPFERLLDEEHAPANVSEWWDGLDVEDPASLRRLPYRPAPSYLATLRVIRQRTKNLRGRDRELAEIRDFATGASDAFGSATESSGYAWVRGGAWAGKTALLAEAFHTLPPEVDAIAFFLTARESHASREHFVAAVVSQLAWLLDTPMPSAPDVAVLRDFWAQAASRAERSHRHVLLVVDGLDEDQRPGGASVAAALPTENLGRHARVLVSSRPHPGLPDDVDAQHPLRVTEPVELTASPDAAELRVEAEREIAALLDPDAAASALAYDVLGLLTAAAGALSVADLADMLEGVKPREVRAFLVNRAARSVQPLRTRHGPRYGFAHQTLLETCQQHPDVGGDPDYQRRLHRWADDWRSRGWPGAEGVARETPDYLLESYALTLAGDAERLAALVCDVGWVDAAVLRTGVDHVLAVLRTAARSSSDPGPPWMLRLLQLQARHLRFVDHAGETATQLAWEALRLDLAAVARQAHDRLRACRGPQLIPEWTTERTSPQLTRAIRADARRVDAVAVTPQGRIASGGDDGVVRLWNPSIADDPGRELGRHEGWVLALAVTREGRIASGGQDGVVRLWNPELEDDPGRELGRHDDWVLALAATAEGRIASTGRDGVVRLWNPDLQDDSGQELGRHDAGVNVNWGFALAVTGLNRVLSGGEDGVVRLWSPDVADDPGRILGRHTRAVTALTVTEQGEVVSGGDDWVIRLWDPDIANDPGRELGRLDGGSVRALAVAGQGRIVSGGADGVVRLWDPGDPGDRGRELGRHDGAAAAVAVTAPGRIVSGGHDGVLRLWDPDLPGDPGHEHSRIDGVWGVATTADGKVVTSDPEGIVRLWDPAVVGDAGHELGRLDDTVLTLAVTAHGLIVWGSDAGSVWIWDPDVAGDGGRELGYHGLRVNALAVTAQGSIISGASDGAVRLWQPDVADDTGRELSHHDGGAYAVADAGRGRVVSSGEDGIVRLWDPDDPDNAGRELGRHEGAAEAVAVTAQGTIVSGGNDGVLLLWDPDRRGVPGRELGRHGSAVRALAVTAQGTTVSGGEDGVVRLWDPDAAGHPGRVLGRHDRDITALAVMDHGKVLVATFGGLTVCDLTPS
jgi:WD40 repeat protein